MNGNDGNDIMYGQGDNDTMHGNAGDDYMEGNSGRDTMNGDENEDDMLGGSGHDDGGTNDAFRELRNVLDDNVGGSGDTMHGDDSFDYMAGDNANITRPGGTHSYDGSARRDVELYDVEVFGGDVISGLASGDDAMTGDASNDVMLGQGGDDTMNGNADEDYMEGNHGGDTMAGDAGQDDMNGGGSANDGVITLAGDFDPGREADGLLDEGDTMYGESDTSDGDSDGNGADAMMGDNAVITRPLAGGLWETNSFNGQFTRIITIADVETTANAPLPAGISGPDDMWGNSNDDLMYGQGDMDEMHGGSGDDYMEGNAASDLMFGQGDEDDMLGGTGPTTSSSQLRELSSGDLATLLQGRTDKSTTDRDGVPSGTGTTGNLTPTIDNVLLGDVMYGGPAADVMLGDNGVIERPLVGGLWDELSYFLEAGSDGTLAPRHPTGAASDRVNRNTNMVDTAPGMTAGSDLMFGEQGDDDMYGQYDDTTAAGVGDEMYGGPGEDAMAGDQGVFDSREQTAPTTHIAPNQPFIEDDIHIQGTLFREFQFPALNQGVQIVIGGADRMRGGEEGDWMHGGAGDDIMNGDELNDRMFGDNGSDTVWGGRQHDHVWGGNDRDFLDVHPRVDESDTSPDSCNPLDPPDPSAWYTFAFDGGGTCDGNLEEVDFIYGGWHADALQANIADNGPRIGDRLIDWVGVYNLYIVCPSTYGEYVITRETSPSMTTFLHQLAEGDGAFMPGPNSGPGAVPTDPSGFNEIAFVYKPGIKSNANPPYIGTPAHFTPSPDCQTFP